MDVPVDPGGPIVLLQREQLGIETNVDRVCLFPSGHYTTHPSRWEATGGRLHIGRPFYAEWGKNASRAGMVVGASPQIPARPAPLRAEGCHGCATV